MSMNINAGDRYACPVLSGKNRISLSGHLFLETGLKPVPTLYAHSIPVLIISANKLRKSETSRFFFFYFTISIFVILKLSICVS